MEHVTPVAVVPAGSDAPQETFCVVDLAMPDSTPGPCVLRCIWRADHFDVELVHEGRVWSKQGAPCISLHHGWAHTRLLTRL
jgi:hypothetical protein